MFILIICGFPLYDYTTIYPFCCWKAALCGGGGDEKAWEEGSRDFTFNTVHQYLISRNRKQAK